MGTQTKRARILLLLFLIIVPVALFGQSTAQISGSISDGSGAVLPGVEVTVTQTDTGCGPVGSDE